MDEDWPSYVLEAKFSQAPGSSKNWDADVFDKYWGLYVAENRETWPADTAGGKRNHPRPKEATLLDHEQHFWMGFVVNGCLDSERLADQGYVDSQIPWLQTEMIRLGWLPS